MSDPSIKWVGAHQNNYGKGRDGRNITKIVMHWIVGTLSSADATFNNPERKASAHYGVGPREIHQYVKEEDTAWHAGNLAVNKNSIGIEHEGGPDIPIAESTYENSARLLAWISERHNIPLDRQHILLHKEIKATQCPGNLDVDRIISMARDILNPPMDYKWLEQMFQERGIDITAGEGASRGNVQEIFDRSSKYHENQERIKQLEAEVVSAKEEAASWEARHEMAESGRTRAEEEAATLRTTVNRHEKTIDQLKRDLERAKELKPEVIYKVDGKDFEVFNLLWLKILIERGDTNA